MNATLPLSFPTSAYSHDLSSLSIFGEDLQDDDGLDDVDLILHRIFHDPAPLLVESFDTRSVERTTLCDMESSSRFVIPVVPNSMYDEHIVAVNTPEGFDRVPNPLEYLKLPAMMLDASVFPLDRATPVTDPCPSCLFAPVSPPSSSHESLEVLDYNWPAESQDNMPTLVGYVTPVTVANSLLPPYQRSVAATKRHRETADQEVLSVGTKTLKAPSASGSTTRSGNGKRRKVEIGSDSGEVMRLRNREHARVSRLRKKNFMAGLQESFEGLKAENDKLRACIDQVFGSKQANRLVNDRLPCEPTALFLRNLQDPKNRVLDSNTISFLKGLGGEAMKVASRRQYSADFLEDAMWVVG